MYHNIASSFQRRGASTIIPETTSGIILESETNDEYFQLQHTLPS